MRLLSFGGEFTLEPGGEAGHPGRNLFSLSSLLQKPSSPPILASSGCPHPPPLRTPSRSRHALFLGLCFPGVRPPTGAARPLRASGLLQPAVCTLASGTWRKLRMIAGSLALVRNNRNAGALTLVPVRASWWFTSTVSISVQAANLDRTTPALFQSCARTGGAYLIIPAGIRCPGRGSRVGALWPQ